MASDHVKLRSDSTDSNVVQSDTVSVLSKRILEKVDRDALVWRGDCKGRELSKWMKSSVSNDKSGNAMP